MGRSGRGGGGRGALYFLAYNGGMDWAIGGEYYVSKPRLYSGNIRPGSRVAYLGWGVAQ
jgi:hypothetical protein